MFLYCYKSFYSGRRFSSEKRIGLWHEKVQSKFEIEGCHCNFSQPNYLRTQYRGALIQEVSGNIEKGK